MGLVPEAYHIQVVIGDFVRLWSGYLLELDRRQSDVLQNRHVGIEVKLLEDHGTVSPYQLDMIRMEQAFAVKIDFAFGGFFQCVYTAYEGTLPRP
jgi:hypothetical protein